MLFILYFEHIDIAGQLVPVPGTRVGVAARLVSSSHPVPYLAGVAWHPVEQVQTRRKYC